VPRSKTPEEWLQRQVGFLSQWGDEVAVSDPEIHHTYGPHTGLKLAALNHAVGVFAPIARAVVDRGMYRTSVFLDLFAGCGVTRIPSTGDYLAGSPVIAAHARPAFDELICIERNPKFATALERRLRLANSPKSQVVTGDCNEVAEELEASIDKRAIVFTVVDPEGMEILWSTMKRVGGMAPANDFFVNFTFGADRELAAAKVAGRPSPLLEGLMGMRLEQILLDDAGDLASTYEDQVRVTLGKRVGDSSLIRGPSGQPLYHVLVYARNTKGGSPWGKAYGDIHRRLATLTSDHVLGALNDIKKRGLSGTWN
jgi:three-Cys-motif partner protein